MAARVGSAIIDDMCGKGIFNLWSPITVSYDETNRLYRVQKGYSIFNQGGFVILNQDTGEVVRALRYK
ncbi:MAG: hypothetical protein IKA76_03155 [Clostridia bacterium]|nr:hypothetical protein [Clostridia bacterium]